MEPPVTGLSAGLLSYPEPKIKIHNVAQLPRQSTARPP